MYELGGSSAKQALNNTDVHLKSFPHPPYVAHEFIGVLGFLLSVGTSLLILSAFVCQYVVLEKEKKLKVSNV